MSDTIAIGALRELTEHGIHAPDDVRLMGFDGIPFSACTNPPISTVAMDVPANGSYGYRSHGDAERVEPTA